jgi:hypothetical protein
LFPIEDFQRPAFSDCKRIAEEASMKKHPVKSQNIRSSLLAQGKERLIRYAIRLQPCIEKAEIARLRAVTGV